MLSTQVFFYLDNLLLFTKINEIMHSLIGTLYYGVMLGIVAL